MSGNYDVIIIGSGAGGGTLARQLAPTGKRILILERGDWLKREAVNWDAKAVFVDNRYVGCQERSESFPSWRSKRGPLRRREVPRRAEGEARPRCVWFL